MDLENRQKIKDIFLEKKARERFFSHMEKVPTLTEREKKVVFYRFGFEDGVIHTLEETGKIFGITRERVRQIEEKVFDRTLLYWSEKLFTSSLTNT